METESVKSGFSDQSLRLKPHSKHTSRSNSNRNGYSHNRSLNRSVKSYRSERDNMSPYQTAVTIEDSRGGQEVIEVQILPQDENWGENTTAITGNTSEQSGSVEDMALWPGSETDSGIKFFCHRYITSIVTIVFSLIAFLSPLVMLILPKIGFFPSVVANLNDQQKAMLLSCRTECKGMMITLVFKMILLAIGSWAIFLRRPRSTMPRIFLFRSAVLLLVLICCVAYWLFYFVQITEGARGMVKGEDELEYKTLVSYASSLVDTLLFIHYIGVILIEIKHLQPRYYVKVVRSPDGESRSYAIGQLSIQRAAVWILERYYTEFSIYNPYLERLPVSKSKKSTTSFKFYDVDNFTNNTLQNSQSRTVLNGHSRRRDSSHNERFYEEHDYERRVKKRKARLVTATEEAFTHVKRINHDPSGGMPMDPTEAAQAVFPSLARSLQKYLRVTRQQPRHSVESILQHLSICLSHDLSPRAFLEPFLSTAPVLQNEKEQKPIQNWSLICNEMLSRPMKNGTTFQLRQNDVSLLCTIYDLPHFNISEEIIHPKSNRFLLRLSSETSV
ncbi:vang-like protein 2-B isoform X1 [Planococcus citri]|uniref:vang-like protein 2-B isoform X1 n=1 Tax=Planococcus citri TaxID=170843 RepID=UPI0031F78FC3